MARTPLVHKKLLLKETSEEDRRYQPPVQPVVWTVRHKKQYDEAGRPMPPPNENAALVKTRMWVRALALGASALGSLPDRCCAEAKLDPEFIDIPLVVDEPVLVLSR